MLPTLYFEKPGGIDGLTDQEFEFSKKEGVQITKIMLSRCDDMQSDLWFPITVFGMHDTLVFEPDVQIFFSTLIDIAKAARAGELPEVDVAKVRALEMEGYTDIERNGAQVDASTLNALERFLDFVTENAVVSDILKEHGIHV